MIEQILPNLFRIEVPLPRSPLKTLNSYLIRGKQRSVIVDTGFNREECLSAMTDALSKLKVDLNNTDFFITHMHSDHLGLVGKLATPGSRVYLNKIETDMRNDKQRDTRKENGKVFLIHGFPPDELEVSADSHPAKRFALDREIDFSIVNEGDKIQTEDFCFTCIDTRGHSPGHMSLYEPDKKVLIAGDHILFDITPNISFWPNMEDPLKTYLSNLDKVYDFDIKLVLPGHRNFMNDYRKRINELKEHHRNRAIEAIKALEDGAKTCYDVAPHLTWDIKYKSWKEFPVQQKWFAFGETLAHLIYLEHEGNVREIRKDGIIKFSLV